MSDSSSGRVSIEMVWLALGHRTAAAAGSFTALVALFQHVPVPVACARGAVAWLTIWALARGTRWLMGRTSRESEQKLGDDPVEYQQGDPGS